MNPSVSRKTWLYTAVLALIALILLATAPVSADVIMPINPTTVYFEKNGAPVNGTVTFNINCYGNHPSGSPPSPAKSSGTEPVFWSSGTCPSYGCTIFERYLNVNTLQIGSCDIDGELNGEHFIIKNFASTPKPDCRSLRTDDALFLQINNRWDKCIGSITGDLSTKEGLADYYAREDACNKQFDDELIRNGIVMTNMHQPADELCTLRFSIPSEGWVPTPLISRTPKMEPQSYSYLPLPLYVVLISLVLAGGLAVMVRRKKTR